MTRGRPFGDGNPGNRAGRPKGSRNTTTLAVEALLEGEAEALTRRAISMALDGDGPAMRLCLERLVPPRRERPVQFDLPPVATIADVPTVTRALLEAVAAGDLTPGEAAELGKLAVAHVEALKATDLDERLRRIEETMKA